MPHSWQDATSKVILCLLAVLVVVEAQLRARDLPPFGSFGTPCAHLTGSVYGSSIRASFNGTLIAFHPLKVGTQDEYDQEAMVIFQLSYLYEARLSNPLAGARAAVDPIMRLLNISECRCSLNEVHREAPGSKEDGFELAMTDCPSDPPLVATLTATSINATKVTTYNDTMPGSIVDSFNYTHTAGSIKLGLKLSNWTWVNQTGTYLACILDTGFMSSYPTQVAIQSDDTSIIMNSFLGQYNFPFIFDIGYLLDDQPVVPNVTLDVFPLNLPSGTNGTVPLRLYRAYAEPIPPIPTFSTRNWREVFYDPSISVIFGTVEPQSKGNSPSPSRNNTWIIAVSVSVPIILIALVSLILVVYFVPSVRIFFRPFSKPRETSTSTSQNNWKHSRTPSTL